MAEAIGEDPTHNSVPQYHDVPRLIFLMSFVNSLHCKSLPQVLAEGSTWMRDGTLLAVRTELQHDAPMLFTCLIVSHLFSSMYEYKGTFQHGSLDPWLVLTSAAIYSSDGVVATHFPIICHHVSSHVITIAVLCLGYSPANKRVDMDFLSHLQIIFQTKLVFFFIYIMF